MNRRTIRLAIVAVFSVCLISCAQRGLERPAVIADRTITGELVKQHVAYLASDALKGRNTPSAELDTAAQYIAEVFRSSGLQPVNGSFFEKVPLGMVGLGEDNHLKITKDNAERAYTIKTEYTPFDVTGNKEARAPIVFAGYGIAAPEYKYDDYGGIDVKGKIVFVLRHEPGEDDSSSVFDGKKPTKYSDVSQKVKSAIAHGAVGVMVATDPLNHTSLTPRGFPWPSLSRTIPKDALPINLLTDEKDKVPVLHVGSEVIGQLFGSVEALKQIQADIDKSVKPRSYEIAGAVASMKTTTVIKDMATRNVVGYCEGSDPKLKNELVVIGAHYDHVGYQKEHEPGKPYIYNGADDNASGTAGVLALAQAFGQLSQKPKRSILFMTFAGEEKGLFGSRSYVEKPLFPLEQTVAMLNLDMVSRNSIDTLWMVGQGRSPDLAKINAEENNDVGFVLVADDKAIGGSDHMSFYRKRIPFLFYFAGFHPDYHQLTDKSDLINAPKLAKVARLAFRTAWRVANDDKRYQVIQNP